MALAFNAPVDGGVVNGRRAALPFQGVDLGRPSAIGGQEPEGGPHAFSGRELCAHFHVAVLEGETGRLGWRTSGCNDSGCVIVTMLALFFSGEVQVSVRD